jgi:membrane protein implicated in regulation of membrane protease activity
MLRLIVIALGVALLGVAAWIAISRTAVWPAAVECGIFGVLVLVGTFLEARYRSRRAGTGSWQTTGERFLDPTTGMLTEVRYDPQSGQRSYEPSESKRYPPV